MRTGILSVAALVLLSHKAVAQAGASTPATSSTAVTTASFAWLAGSWEGRMVGRPGVVDITYTQPRAGTITGVMRLVDDDKVLVVELLTNVDAPGLSAGRTSSTIKANRQ